MSKTHLGETFVELADTLVDDFDVIDFLHMLAGRCVDLLDVQAAGLLLVDQNNRLRVLAASSEQARLLELFQLQNDEGPCLACYRSGAAVTVADLTNPALNRKWPNFADAASSAGFASVHALPMRLRDQVIGAMNLFSVSTGEIDPQTERVGQSLVNVATIGLLQYQNARNHERLAEQLQAALQSRVVIEQAKGVLAERFGLDMPLAFETMRTYARSHSMLLSEVARQVITKTVDLGGLSESGRT